MRGWLQFTDEFSGLLQVLLVQGEFVLEQLLYLSTLGRGYQRHFYCPTNKNVKGELVPSISFVECRAAQLREILCMFGCRSEEGLAHRIVVQSDISASERR